MPNIPQVMPSDFRDMLKTIPDSSIDLAVADWPFNKGEVDKTVLKMFHDGTKEAARILVKGGNFVSVHYLHNNIKVSAEAERQGLLLRDHIVIPMVKKVKHKQEQGRAFITIFAFSKGKTRTFNGSSRAGRFFSLEEWETDLWNETKFRNGYWRKASDIMVSEAMPKRVVDQVLDLYQGPKVVDYFGGSGNFPVACLERGLDCTASELNSNHFKLINQRLAETAKTLINQAMQQSYTTGGQ